MVAQRALQGHGEAKYALGLAYAEGRGIGANRMRPSAGCGTPRATATTGERVRAQGRAELKPRPGEAPAPPARAARLRRPQMAARPSNEQRTRRRRQSSRALYLRLLSYVRPYAKVFGLAVLGMIAAAATEPLFPALIKPLLDRGFGPGTQGTVPPILFAAAIVGIFVLRGMLTFGSSYLLAWVGNRVVLDLRAAMFARLVRLPARFFGRPRRPRTVRGRGAPRGARRERVGVRAVRHPRGSRHMHHKVGPSGGGSISSVTRKPCPV